MKTNYKFLRLEPRNSQIRIVLQKTIKKEIFCTFGEIEEMEKELSKKDFSEAKRLYKSFTENVTNANDICDSKELE